MPPNWRRKFCLKPRCSNVPYWCVTQWCRVVLGGSKWMFGLLLSAGLSRKMVETHKCKRRADSTLLAGADCEVSFRHLNSPQVWQSAAVFSRSKAPHIFSHGNCGLCDTLLQVLTSFLLATTKQIHPVSVHIDTTLTLWPSLITDSPSKVF